MGSKAIMFLGLLLAVFLMISSEVVARELAETSNSVNEVDVDGIGGDHYYGGYHKGYGKGYGKGKCHYKCKKYCCSYEEYMAMQKATETPAKN